MPLAVKPRIRPSLDPDFLPAILWNRAYRTLVADDRNARNIALVLQRVDGSSWVHPDRVLSATHPEAKHNLRYVERLLKFLLWQKGGCRVFLEGADEIAGLLSVMYSPNGERSFDHAFMGKTVFDEPFSVSAGKPLSGASDSETVIDQGRHLEGCRIGFDLGGSDRKAAAIIDGKVVFSEEIAWDPYFQKDPNYHIDGIRDSIKRAAAHLPRVDAIGGSAAGVYIKNEVRVASLFRGISAELFERKIRRVFLELKREFGNVPFEVVNDGEVTALAGSMAMNDNAVLGVSMGTSMAGGYVTPSGNITPWLNELAFAPVDYRDDAPRDEWSGDQGCGVQYFSQQCVARLAATAGICLPEKMPQPERLVVVQDALKQGDPRAKAIYESIGVYFGYSIAHYAEFYQIRNLLVLGRVSSGEGGELIIAEAQRVLSEEFPLLAKTITLRTPDEQSKRHGQAIAAASLPALA